MPEKELITHETHDSQIYEMTVAVDALQMKVETSRSPERALDPFAQLTQEFTSLAEKMADSEFPWFGHFSELTRGLQGIIESDEYTLDDFATMIKAVREGEMSVRTRCDSRRYFHDPFICFDLLDKVSDTKYREIVDQEHTTLRDELLEISEAALKYSNDPHHPTWITGLRARSRLFGYADMVDYFAAIRRDQVDTAPQKVKIDVVANAQVALEDYPREYPYKGNALAYMQNEFAKRLLVECLGFSGDLAEGVQEAMRRRIRDKDDGKAIDQRAHKKELIDLIERNRWFTPGALEKIRQSSGIVNFGEYSRDQLNRMLQFAKKDPELLESLASKPLVVCVRDANRDHNKAFSVVPTQFESEEGTTLYFEVSDPSEGVVELKTYVEALKAHGLGPEVVVLAAHGLTYDEEEKTEPDGFNIGNAIITYDEVAVEKYTKRWPESMSIDDAEGIKELFSLMQPDEEGYCNVIFLSCGQGSRRTKYKISHAEVLADIVAEASEHRGVVRVIGEYIAAAPVKDFDNGIRFHDATTAFVQVDQMSGRLKRGTISGAGVVFNAFKRKGQSSTSFNLNWKDSR